jgi:signal transduction histidine kinase
MPQRLSRLLSQARDPAELMPALAHAAVDEVGADAAAIVEMLSTGDFKITAADNLPDVGTEWSNAVESIDSELGELLRAACGGRFVAARTLPLASGHHLFGALVLLFESQESARASHIDLAEGLAAFAGHAIGNAYHFDELRKSYTEVRATRETLERTEKLRALGEMAAGVSHDLKNILNPLSLHLQLLKRSLKRGGEGATEAIAEMEQIVRRGVETCERLREFSRQAPESRAEAVELNAIVNEAIGICRPRLSSKVRSRGIKIVSELGDPPHVVARPAQLVAALVNLIGNAIDALTEGGTIRIKTTNDESGGSVFVSDDGPGIPPELESRIFQPFFTTKGREGTGLGLAMAYAFAQRHGGKLTLETTPGHGATFTLSLPRAPGPQE